MFCPQVWILVSLYSCFHFDWPPVKKLDPTDQSFLCILPTQEPWEYHYPTVFGTRYVEGALGVRLRGCILGGGRQMVKGQR